MTPAEITAHLRLIENQLHELRSRIESTPGLAPPFSAAEANHTDAPEVRNALLGRWFEIGPRLARLAHFSAAQLRYELEQYITLLPGDSHQPDPSHVRWHSTVNNAIRAWPAEWGEPLVEHLGRNKWRVTEYGKSIL